MTDQRWLRAAILDDKLVAHLLLRLKHSFTPSHLPTWGLRQPRSKPSTPEKRAEIRRSPVGPLSWTGGCGSPSEGDFQESSSLSLLSYRFRSKVSTASDTPTTSSKKCKRKKTFAELKEEESSLLTEHTYLKKELATLRVTLEEQRSINQNLKRMKLNLQVEYGLKSEANSAPVEQSTFLLNRISEARQVKYEYASEQSSQKPVFVLPDLNKDPDEEDELVGMS